MSCLFCDIAAKRTEAAIVFEDDRVVAFLDHRPLFAGHLLLVPREHVETLADLPSHLIAPLFGTAQRLVSAVEQAMQAEGTFVALNNRVSQSVPHLHVHIVPRRKGDGLHGFFWPRKKYGEGEMEAVLNSLRGALSDQIQT